MNSAKSNVILERVWTKQILCFYYDLKLSLLIIFVEDFDYFLLNTVVETKFEPPTKKMKPPTKKDIQKWYTKEIFLKIWKD